MTQSAERLLWTSACSQKDPVALWYLCTSPDRLELEQKRETGSITVAQGLVWALASKPWDHISQKEQKH